MLTITESIKLTSKLDSVSTWIYNSSLDLSISRIKFAIPCTESFFVKSYALFHSGSLNVYSYFLILLFHFLVFSRKYSRRENEDIKKMHTT